MTTAANYPKKSKEGTSERVSEKEMERERKREREGSLCFPRRFVKQQSSMRLGGQARPSGGKKNSREKENMEKKVGEKSKAERGETSSQQI